MACAERARATARRRSKQCGETNLLRGERVARRSDSEPGQDSRKEKVASNHTNAAKRVQGGYFHEIVQLWTPAPKRAIIRPASARRP